MRDAFGAILIGAALSITPVAASTATKVPESPFLDGGLQSKAVTVARHATRGTVKSIDATTLVLARAGNRGEMTFELNPSIHRQGTIGVGITVSVRYQDTGTRHVATAITVEKPAQVATR